jgi:lactate racemase
MNSVLAYGKSSLKVDLPDHTDVIEPLFTPGAVDQVYEVVKALQNPIGHEPLRNLVKKNHKVGIIFSDITRPTPYDVILPAIFSEISHVSKENITLFNATGTHRLNTVDELVKILGKEVVETYRIVQNECEDRKNHRYIGTTKGGNRIEIMSEFLDCDIRILTGFIEPHFVAGFSGGGKAVMPGLASLKTILFNHNALNMEHSNARWGVTESNPLWEEITEAAGFADPTFLLNVALNKHLEVTEVFAGDLQEAHRRGCEYVKRNAMAGVEEPYDIVVTSNSGYPLDLNMYQAVKGMSAARQIVKKGGHIIIAAECWDGIPSHGMYRKLLHEGSSPEDLLRRIKTPGFAMQDQWQAQIHALICQWATVHFYSENLTDEELKNTFMVPCRDISKRVKELVEVTGSDTRICVLPEGPQTIPYLK